MPQSAASGALCADRHAATTTEVTIASTTEITARHCMRALMIVVHREGRKEREDNA
jgi:hypothetical protein